MKLAIHGNNLIQLPPAYWAMLSIPERKEGCLFIAQSALASQIPIYTPRWREALNKTRHIPC